MAQRKQSFAVGEYYHLYNRGVEKRNVFLDSSDYKKFQFLLHVCNTRKTIVLRDIPKFFERGESVVDIGAYCLMKNHFHVLVREKVEGGITSFMRKVLTAYSMYFNKKYNRTGKLWQGVFQSSHADSDNYLKYLYSYIHLNPAKYVDPKWRENISVNRNEIFNFVKDYNYSSLPAYISSIKGYANSILNKKAFPEYFATSGEHERELNEWLNFHP